MASRQWYSRSLAALVCSRDLLAQVEEATASIVTLEWTLPTLQERGFYDKYGTRFFLLYSANRRVLSLTDIVAADADVHLVAPATVDSQNDMYTTIVTGAQYTLRHDEPDSYEVVSFEGRSLVFDVQID
ncbi:MAG: hypothetical protein MHM6MM_008627 [Cercozoa sp. M6MM]